jgi:SAM-dependent methyltransferase
MMGGDIGLRAAIEQQCVAREGGSAERAGIAAAFFPEIRAGGFSRLNTTVQFYTRVNALLRPEMVVLDFGAGRGEGVLDEARPYVRALRSLRGKVRRVVGVDVDPVVTANPTLDEAHVLQPDGAGRVALPLAPGSVDLILADWTFEHIADPAGLAAEFLRVLRPNGWVCARTPNRWGYIGVGARLIPNRLHAQILGRVQPQRKREDIFPTVYKLNTPAGIRRYFPASAWLDCSHAVDTDPAYAASSRLLWHAFRLTGALTPQRFLPVLFVFLQKRSG